jgi:hypothetical protein
MPEIRFYAVKRDLNLLFESMFTELGLIAFELVSEPGCPLKNFQTTQELTSHFRYCSRTNNFLWWDPSSMPPKKPLKQKLNPDLCDGHTYRYSADFALIQIETGIMRSKMLTPSEFSLITKDYYQSIGGRVKLDWPAINGKFSQIRKIIERHSIGKVDGCWVMNDAYASLSQGCLLTESLREGFDRFKKQHVKLLKRTK